MGDFKDGDPLFGIFWLSSWDLENLLFPTFVEFQEAAYSLKVGSPQSNWGVSQLLWIIKVMKCLILLIKFKNANC